MNLGHLSPELRLHWNGTTDQLSGPLGVPMLFHCIFRVHKRVTIVRPSGETPIRCGLTSIAIMVMNNPPTRRPKKPTVISGNTKSPPTTPANRNMVTPKIAQTKVSLDTIAHRLPSIQVIRWSIKVNTRELRLIRRQVRQYRLHRVRGRWLRVSLLHLRSRN